MLFHFPFHYWKETQPQFIRYQELEVYKEIGRNLLLVYGQTVCICNEAFYKNLHGFIKVLFSLQGHHGSVSFMGMVQHALFTQ